MAVSRSGYGRLDGILMQWSAERDAICPRILTLKSSDGYKRSVPLLNPVPPCTARVAFLKHGYTLKAVILDLDSLLDA